MGFLGARVLYILTRLDYFIADPGAILPRLGGGPRVSRRTDRLYSFRDLVHEEAQASRLANVSDILVIGLTVNHAFGRLGCLAAGCCYGKPTGTSLGYSPLFRSR